MEFENITTIGAAETDDRKKQTLNEWLHDYLLDLKNDGVDINSDTPPGIFRAACHDPHQISVAASVRPVGEPAIRSSNS